MTDMSNLDFRDYTGNKYRNTVLGIPLPVTTTWDDTNKFTSVCGGLVVIKHTFVRRSPTNYIAHVTQIRALGLFDVKSVPLYVPVGTRIYQTLTSASPDGKNLKYDANIEFDQYSAGYRLRSKS